MTNDLFLRCPIITIAINGIGHEPVGVHPYTYTRKYTD